MPPLVWVALASFWAGGKLSRTTEQEAIGKLVVPDFSLAMRVKLVADPTDTRQVFSSEALLPMLGALREGTLERVGRSEDATFYRLIPISERWHPPAVEQIPPSFDAYLSFSCLLENGSEGDRVVAIVPPGSDAVVTRSRMFARFSVKTAFDVLIEKKLQRLTVSPPAAE